MDPSQFFDLTNGSQSAAFPNFMAENTDDSSSPSALPSSSSANRRQRQPSQSARSQPKRQRTEAAGQPQSSRTEAPGQPQQPSQEAQNPPFTAQNNTNNAETGQRPFLYQFQAKLTRIYLSEQEYQSAVRRMKDFTDKPSLVDIMESMAEKLVHADVLAPRRTLNLFPTEPPSFRPAAED